jgi:hypothetical protein
MNPFQILVIMIVCVLLLLILFQVFYRKYSSYSCKTCNSKNSTEEDWVEEPKVFEADSDEDSDISDEEHVINGGRAQE